MLEMLIFSLNHHQIPLTVPGPLFFYFFFFAAKIAMSFQQITKHVVVFTSASLPLLIMPWQVSQDVLLQQPQWCGARQPWRRLDVVDTALTEEGSWGATCATNSLDAVRSIHGDFMVIPWWFHGDLSGISWKWLGFKGDLIGFGNIMVNDLHYLWIL